MAMSKQMDNTGDWSYVEAHIERHEGGCWVWAGAPMACNVYRFVAEAYGAPHPAGQKLYRMPGCKLGKDCVNPNHLGTGADFVLAVKGPRQEIPELPGSVTEIRLTEQDREFLRCIKVRWE